MTKQHPAQADFFIDPVFPTRSPVERIDLERFRSRLKREMARAIRECPFDRRGWPRPAPVPPDSLYF